MPSKILTLEELQQELLTPEPVRNTRTKQEAISLLSKFEQVAGMQIPVPDRKKMIADLIAGAEIDGITNSLEIKKAAGNPTPSEETSGVLSLSDLQRELGKASSGPTSRGKAKTSNKKDFDLLDPGQALTGVRNFFGETFGIENPVKNFVEHGTVTQLSKYADYLSFKLGGVNFENGVINFPQTPQDIEQTEVNRQINAAKTALLHGNAQDKAKAKKTLAELSPSLGATFKEIGKEVVRNPAKAVGGVVNTITAHPEALYPPLAGAGLTKTLALGAGVNAGISAIDQLGETQTIDPTRLTADAILGGVLAAAPKIVSAGGKRVKEKFAKSSEDVAPEGEVATSAPVKEVEVLDNLLTKAEQELQAGKAKTSSVPSVQEVQEILKKPLADRTPEDARRIRKFEKAIPKEDKIVTRTIEEDEVLPILRKPHDSWTPQERDLVNRYADQKDLEQRGETPEQAAKTLVEQDGPTGEVEVNGSGESSASLEAIRRGEEEALRERQRFVVDRFGNVREISGVDAVDAIAGKGEVIVQRGIGREEFTVLSQDQKLTPTQVKLKVNRIKSNFPEKTKLAEAGKIDRTLLVRGALVAGGAAAGIKFADSEHKLAGGLLGGLAGFILPGGGGSVLSKLKQSGAVSFDNGLLGFTSAEIKAGEIKAVAGAKKGDPLAFTALYQQYEKRLFRAVKQITKDPDLAADVVQNSYLKAFQNIKDFKEQSSFYTWLYRIGQNEAFNAIRSKGRRLEDTNIDPEVFEQSVLKQTLETPESLARAEEVQRVIQHALDNLPQDIREAVLLREVEGFDYREISQQTGVPEGTVKSRIFRGREMLQNSLAKDLGAEKVPFKSLGGKQSGGVDPELLKKAGFFTAGATIGAGLAEDEKKVFSALLAGVVTLGIRNNSTAIRKTAKDLIQLNSTKILEISPTVFKRMQQLVKDTTTLSHERNTIVEDFVTEYMKLKKPVRDKLTQINHLSNPELMLQAMGSLKNKKLLNGYIKARELLDSLGAESVQLGRFAKVKPGYLPAVVKDVEGLFKYLGKIQATGLQKILARAEKKSVKESGIGLTDEEKGVLINRYLARAKKNLNIPGYTKARTIKNLTEDILPFYGNLAESLHSHIQQVTYDLEVARFFGGDLKGSKVGNKVYTNLPNSIGALINTEISKGKLAPEKARLLEESLRSHFEGGRKATAKVIQDFQNYSVAMLLGNFIQAGKQATDLFITAAVQGVRPTLFATAAAVARKSKIDVAKDFGLADHLIEEYATTRFSAKVSRKATQFGLFRSLDLFGKTVAANAPMLRAKALLKSPKGVEKFASEYREIFGKEFPELVQDLKAGKKTPNSLLFSWMELSRQHPISQLERPTAFLNSPNTRIAYFLKGYMLKQLDLQVRDGHLKIKQGRTAEGFKQLTKLWLALGLAGATNTAISQMITTGEVSLLPKDVIFGMFKTFGMSEYVFNRMFGQEGQKASPFAAAASTVVPPVRLVDEIITQQKGFEKNLPVVGPFIPQDE